MSLMMNGKEVNHLIISGEQFDKSYTAGVKAKVISSMAWIGSVKTNGTIASGTVGGGGYAKQLGDIVTVIGIYKNAAAILADDRETINFGSWISLNDIEFID